MGDLNRGKVVLLVDDQQDILELLEMELSDDSYQVLTAEGGERAYEIIQNQKVDICISDINMPHGDGPALLDKINTTLDKLMAPKMYFMTAYRPDLKNELIRKGAKGVIFKPFTYEQLKNLITQQG